MNAEQYKQMEARGIPEGCTKKEYRRYYASQERYKALRNNAIFGYALCGFQFLLSVWIGGGYWIDGVVFLIFVLGAHLRRSKGCVFGLTALTAMNALYGIVTQGKMTGWLWIAVASGFLKAFKEIDKEYAELTANRPEL